MDLKNNQAIKASLTIILIGILLIIAVFLSTPPNTPYSQSHVTNPQDAADFLLELGWETDLTNSSMQQSVLPNQFDSVFTEYNALQLQQKCDLSQYAGKAVEIYTIPITNYGNNLEHVYATIIVHNNTVIGGDIHSAALNGFMHTLE